jgi:phage FluMu protein gp41
MMTSTLPIGLQTEYEFTLPMGYVDQEGNLHRQGMMRLATAADEILPLKDPRVQSNPAYLIVILLSRVITRLGNIHPINPNIIESLFAADLSYLQDFYNQINLNGNRVVQVNCPHCQKGFEVELERLGES